MASAHRRAFRRRVIARSAAFRERLRLWSDLIGRHLPSDAVALDAGCGPGVLAAVAARRCARGDGARREREYDRARAPARARRGRREYRVSPRGDRRSRYARGPSLRRDPVLQRSRICRRSRRRARLARGAARAGRRAAGLDAERPLALSPRRKDRLPSRRPAALLRLRAPCPTVTQFARRSDATDCRRCRAVEFYAGPAALRRLRAAARLARADRAALRRWSCAMRSQEERDGRAKASALARAISAGRVAATAPRRTPP